MKAAQLYKCHGAIGASFSILCVPDDYQIGDTFVRNSSGPGQSFNDVFFLIRSFNTSNNSFCTDSVPPIASNPDGLSSQELYESGIYTFTKSPMNPCPNCCNKIESYPWAVQTSDGELNASGYSFSFPTPTENDVKTSMCKRRCKDKAVIPGKDGGEEIQQIDKSLQESIIKRLQKLAGIKK